MPRLAKPLPVLHDDPPHIAGDGEGLAVFMAPVNDPWIRATMGDERVIQETNALPGCRITEGERFKIARGGAVQGRRYLWTTTGHDVLGVLHITLQFEPGRRQPRANISNVFVQPGQRRQGMATALIQRARQDFPELKVDSSMTYPGAALFLGQEPASNAKALLSDRKSERPALNEVNEINDLLSVEPTLQTRSIDDVGSIHANKRPKAR